MPHSGHAPICRGGLGASMMRRICAEAPAISVVSSAPAWWVRSSWGACEPDGGLLQRGDGFADHFGAETRHAPVGGAASVVGGDLGEAGCADGDVDA